MAGEQSPSAPTNLQQPPDEDYIDMDVSTSTFLYFSSSTSPPFEFRHLPSSKHPMNKEPITSPADELFYKGKLLPLHLPPRLQMVEKLLLADPSPPRSATKPGPWIPSGAGDRLQRQGARSSNTTPTFLSCNATPSGSCHVSGELNPEEYFHDCPDEFTSRSSAKKATWGRRFKSIKQSTLSHKLRASGAYILSLFSTSNKSLCPDDSRASYTPKEGSGSSAKSGRKNPYGRTRKDHRGSIEKARVLEGDSFTAERKSCSSAIGGGISSCSSTSSSSSSSSSFSVSGSTTGQCGSRTGPLLKRSSSVNSEMESPILGAIAHCKSSQQIIGGSGRKSLSDVGCYSARIAAVTAAAATEDAATIPDITGEW